MKKWLRRISVLLVSAAVSLSVFAACAPKNSGDDDVDWTTLPDIDRSEKVTLTIWSPLEQWAPDSTYDKNVIYQRAAEELNLELEFIHPPVGQETDQFNLMIVEKDLPDIIFCGNWYPGGVQEGISHGIYRNVNDYLPKYAPDYYRRLTANPDILREATMDNGDIGAVWGFAEYEEWCYSGPIFNKKALDAIGEDAPVTIEDWDRVLGKFKNELGMNSAFAIHPLGLQYLEQAIISAYGAASGFIKDPATGEVKYGPAENGYIDYLNLIRGWYDKGYIPTSFTTNDWLTNVDNFKAMQTGVMFDNPQNAAALIGEYGKDWIDAPYPVLNEGDKLQIRLKNWYVQSNNSAWNTCGVVTKSCENLDRALDFLNWGFTDEGIMAYNYGTEGVTYNMVDGEPVFTDYLFDNDITGTDIYSALYRFKCHNGIFVRQEKTANPLIQRYPENISIMERWTEQAGTDALLPPISYTRNEQHVIDLYFTDITQYVEEQQMKFITGQTNDISNTAVATYDSTFRANLTGMGIDDILGVVSSALERYNERTSEE